MEEYIEVKMVSFFNNFTVDNWFTDNRSNVQLRNIIHISFQKFFTKYNRYKLRFIDLQIRNLDIFNRCRSWIINGDK
jgi:hypothetical protein